MLSPSDPKHDKNVDFRAPARRWTGVLGRPAKKEKRKAPGRPLFTDDGTSYVENPKEPGKNLSGLGNSLDTSNNQPNDNITKAVSRTTVTLRDKLNK